MAAILPKKPALRPRRPLLDVYDRPCQPERSALARRTIQRLAVRTGEGDRRASKKTTKGRGAVRDRLWTVRLAAYRHLRRGRAHHHGASRIPRAYRGQDQDPPGCDLRRPGLVAQVAGPRAEQGDAGKASRKAADKGTGPVRHP